MHTLLLVIGEQDQAIRIHAHVIRIQCFASPVHRDHVCHTNGVESVYPQPGCCSVNAEDFALAVLRATSVGACGAVVIEETVKTGSIYPDIVTIRDAQANSIAVTGQAGAVVWIVDG